MGGVRRGGCCRGFSERLDPVVRHVKLLRRCHGGQGGPGTAGGEQLLGNSLPTAAGLGQFPSVWD
jgi:hypothetical protein